MNGKLGDLLGKRVDIRRMYLELSASTCSGSEIFTGLQDRPKE
jgi:hypothetical protein